jgi:hypothetical protein
MGAWVEFRAIIHRHTQNDGTWVSPFYAISQQAKCMEVYSVVEAANATDEV